MQRLVLFIVGVQKGGTTALDSYLRQSPHLQMARRKEIHFFDNERLDWPVTDYTGLHAEFDWTDSAARIRGESTPIYSYWPNSMERIKIYNPGAKLILCLRHPAFRAYSHWRMERGRSAETLSFEEAISKMGRSRVSSAPCGVHRVYSYVERGFYASQVLRLFELFGKRQVQTLRTDRLWSNPAETIGAVHAHLGLGEPLPLKRRYVVPVHSRGSGRLPAESRARLDRIFHDDIRRTAELTGLDLSDWLDPSYEEPMQDYLDSA